MQSRAASIIESLFHGVISSVNIIIIYSFYSYKIVDESEAFMFGFYANLLCIVLYYLIRRLFNLILLSNISTAKIDEREKKEIDKLIVQNSNDKLSGKPGTIIIDDIQDDTPMTEEQRKKLLLWYDKLNIK